jgi:hypothetical protein
MIQHVPRKPHLVGDDDRGAVANRQVATGLSLPGCVGRAPGLFSSFGLLYSEIEHHYSRSRSAVV